jgi:medium-chain acyl-[acyl-carrier-protein] hydrolase
MQTRWLVRDPEQTSGKTRLFCFPYAGAGASAYARWQEALPELDVLPVTLPGRERRFKEPSYTRMEPLVDELAQEILPFCDGSFALFGHSLGAIVAFELARRAERAGRTPERLFVSGREPPDRRSPADDAYRLDDDSLCEVVRRLGGTAADLFDDPEVREVFLPIIRADFELAGTYRYEASSLLRCPVSTFYAEDDADSYDGVKDWERMTLGPWHAEGFRGGHLFAFADERERVLASILRALGVARADPA